MFLAVLIKETISELATIFEDNPSTDFGAFAELSAILPFTGPTSGATFCFCTCSCLTRAAFASCCGFKTKNS